MTCDEGGLVLLLLGKERQLALTISWRAIGHLAPIVYVEGYHLAVLDVTAYYEGTISPCSDSNGEVPDYFAVTSYGEGTRSPCYGCLWGGDEITFL
jgi:hypothetical protein